jgi:hypothetical protein
VYVDLDVVVVVVAAAAAAADYNDDIHFAADVAVVAFEKFVEVDAVVAAAVDVDAFHYLAVVVVVVVVDVVVELGVVAVDDDDDGAAAVVFADVDVGDEVFDVDIVVVVPSVLVSHSLI